MEFELGPKTTELLGVLRQLELLLQENMHWSFWVTDVIARLDQSDFSGVDKLLSAYGGIGSLNDLVLGQEVLNGIFRWADNATELNEQLSHLLAKAWELASDIKRNVEITD